MGEPERHVALEACFNLRDLGGYATADGRRVRWRSVFRSDSLHRLTTGDLETVAALGVRTVIDLRTSRELAEYGSFVGDAVERHHLPPFEDGPDAPPPVQSDDPEPPPGEVYLQIAMDGASRITEALRAIATGEYALVFHCAAGKDRTGILAALVLSVLGVPDDVIVADYHLSERSLAPAEEWAAANDAEWAAWMRSAPPWLLRSPPQVMEAFLGNLRETHGSVEGYLESHGLETEVVGALRERLLE